MRAPFAAAILLLGISSAAPEPEFFSFTADGLNAAPFAAGFPLVEIESSVGRGDRRRIAAVAPRDLVFAAAQDDGADRHVQLASADPDITSAIAVSTDTAPSSRASLGDLCNALYRSALNNDLPVQFFANLIWQESRLKDDIVSKKGAMGIAQFMPDAAVENGLSDPFDPLQAIPASAHFLNQLRLQFGNLGFVAAAYNAGPRRVVEWLEHHGSLPQETRDYVVRVTGLSIEAWRDMPIDSGALTFVSHLPCRSEPAFASVEQEQLEQALIDQAKVQQANADETLADDPPAPDPARGSVQGSADARKHSRDRHEAQHAPHERHPARHEAARTAHAAHEKRRSV